MRGVKSLPKSKLFAPRSCFIEYKCVTLQNKILNRNNP